MNSNPCDSDSIELKSMMKKTKEDAVSRKTVVELTRYEFTKLMRILCVLGELFEGWQMRSGSVFTRSIPRKTSCVDPARASKHAINLPRSVYRETNWERRTKKPRYIKHIIFLTWEKKRLPHMALKHPMNSRCSARKGITNRIRSS